MTSAMKTSRSTTSITSSLRVKSSSASATAKHEKPSSSYVASHLKLSRPKQSSSSALTAISSSSRPTLPSSSCVSCGYKSVELRKVTRSFGRGATLLVIENIPIWSCPHCGESYFSAQTMHEIERIKTLRKSVAVDRSVSVAEFLELRA